MLYFRRACLTDVELLYEWANDEVVRANSYNQNPIAYENHVKWFDTKLEDPATLILIFMNEEQTAIGQVRFQIEIDHAVIGIVVDKRQRGRGYAIEMLKQASAYFHELHPEKVIDAFVKVQNLPSYHAFLKAGYSLKEILLYNGKDESFKLVKSK